MIRTAQYELEVDEDEPEIITIETQGVQKRYIVYGYFEDGNDEFAILSEVDANGNEVEECIFGVVRIGIGDDGDNTYLDVPEAKGREILEWYIAAARRAELENN